MKRALRLALPFVLALASLAPGAAPRRVGGTRGMAGIAGGSFRPVFGHTGAAIVHVAKFALDTVPVSEAEFLGFVQKHRRWAQENVPALFADRNYLQGVRGSALQPVTNVSWYAAEAYCQARGARLPTTNEWEFAARASETERHGIARASFRQRALELASSGHRSGRMIGSGLRNIWGVRDLHGGVTEWTRDFKPMDRSMTCAAGALQTGDASDYAAFMRYGFRAAAEERMTSGAVGFRCAAGL